MNTPMITDANIKKRKKNFTTREDLKKLTYKFETKFVTRIGLKTEVEILNRKNGILDKKINVSIQEILNFIVEIKNDIMKELNEFRNEMREINRGNQSILNNYESRITHLEYIKKS